MELRVLRYFLAVAREENITKAAGLLHISQPSLSRQLMQMEETLGVKLFKRSRHRVILTERGGFYAAGHRKSLPWQIKRKKNWHRAKTVSAVKFRLDAGKQKIWLICRR